MPLPISVIIPCYKQEQWLQSAVDSARLQSADVSIVYDGDRRNHPGYWDYDNTGSYQIGGDFRAGVCYARNFAIDFCNDDNLIFCLDADDILYPDALERMVAAWQPGTWVYGRYTEIDEQGNVIRECDVPPPGTIHRKNLTYSSFLFHKDDWRKAGGYDPLFEFGDEDYAFQVALTDAGVRPVRLDGAPVYQRMLHPRGSRTERAVKYFPMVLELLREKYPATMKP